MTKITDALSHIERSSLVSKESIDRLANESIKYYYQILGESTAAIHTSQETGQTKQRVLAVWNDRGENT